MKVLTFSVKTTRDGTHPTAPPPAQDHGGQHAHRAGGGDGQLGLAGLDSPPLQSSRAETWPGLRTPEHDSLRGLRSVPGLGAIYRVSLILVASDKELSVSRIPNKIVRTTNTSNCVPGSKLTL